MRQDKLESANQALGIEIDNLKRKIVEIKHALPESLNVSTRGFRAHERFFSDISVTFVGYANRRGGPYYFLLHRSQSAEAYTKGIVNSAKKVAKLFESYGKQPAKFSRVECAIAIEDLLSMLDNLLHTWQINNMTGFSNQNVQAKSDESEKARRGANFRQPAESNEENETSNFQPPSSKQVQPPSKIATLTEIIQTGFSLDEIKNLCIELGVEYENLLGGEQRVAKSRELVLYFNRRGELQILENKLKELRPHAFGN